MSKELKIAACYIRVSTDKQEELSPTSQLKEIKKWAKDNGYILTNEYIFMEHEGVSGRKADNRVEFQRMIATAKLKPKPFDAIILWKFSRFARNQEESTFYKGMLRKKLGIDVISISEYVSDDMFGRLIETIIEWFDEYYSVNLSGEVTRGMTEKALRGGYQSTLPYGYKQNKDTGIPEIVDEEAAIVKLIFEMAGNPAYSNHEIVRKINSMNIPTRRGNTWELRTVRYIVENPFYYGFVRWNRQHHESHTIKDKSEWIIAEGKHTPLITKEQFDQAQQIIERRARMRKPKQRIVGTKHWLSGFLKCSACGYSLFIGCRDKKTGMRSLQCGNYQKGKCSVSHSITEKKITEGLTLALKELLKDASLSTYQQAMSQVTIPTDSFISTALEKLEQKEKRIKQAYRDGIDSLEEYKENKEILNAERERLMDELEKSKSMSENHTETIDLPKEINSVIQIINSDANDTIKGEAIRSILDYAIYEKSKNRLQVHLTECPQPL